ncbi:cysteine--tRNA ligase [Candidatus Dependentiae bacterium]|nr:cysteine--tRNA ligase [Candidatus Dependentiae bacterium]
MIQLYSTLSTRKETISPLQEGKIKLYVCGITPYDNPHIGHGRVFVTFDLLYRLLKTIGLDVTYCRNFTDIDDKLLKKAETEFGDPLRYHEIAQRYIASFNRDMKALNLDTPSHEPLVTKTIPEIIDFVAQLVEQKKAYAIDGDVYFRINSFPSYGKLSKQKLDELRAGARVEINDKKEDPLDFALWKGEKEGTFWESPWGYGRPGWHIECSAMALKYLGEQIDIHGGGADLIFPHHENEIAQTESLTRKPFSTIWSHCAFVRVNNEKMSKSLGNFFTLNDIFQQFDPMVIRYYYAIHHYRTPLDFSFNDIQAAQKAYQKICLFFAHTEVKKNSPIDRENATLKKMLTFLYDDLNTPGMFGVLFTFMQSKPNAHEKAAIKQFLVNGLGLTLEPLPEKTIQITPEIQKLLDDREKAREEKNWKRADELRAQLISLGVDLHDKKSKEIK